MHVKLVVVGGKSAGTAVPVTVRKFFIGRAHDCHLRPSSDQVSRHHCAILVGDTAVAVCDLGSRTGTRVNDKEVKGQQALRTGDRLTVGPLQFEIRVDAAESGTRKGDTQRVQTAATRPVAPADESDLDLSEWLGVPAPTTPTSEIKVPQDAGAPSSAAQPAAEAAKSAENPPKTDLTEQEKEEARRQSAMVGVSQTLQARRGTATPRDAAAAALKNFFGRK